MKNKSSNNRSAKNKLVELVLLEDLKGSGKKGDVINAAPGYASFLLSNNKAKEATKAALQEIEDRKKSDEHKMDLKKQDAKIIKQTIDGQSIDFYVEAGPTGVLHESINSSRIGNMIKEKYNVDVDRRKITIIGDDNIIKTFGVFNASIQLFPDIIANITINVSEDINAYK